MGAAMELIPYTFVILRRPATAPDLPVEELDRLQERHLAHLTAMRANGSMLLSGPLVDQPEESWRGFCLYRTSIEETRRLAADDPSVVAGRLSLEYFNWLMPDGNILNRALLTGMLPGWDVG